MHGFGSSHSGRCENCQFCRTDRCAVLNLGGAALGFSAELCEKPVEDSFLAFNGGAANLTKERDCVWLRQGCVLQPLIAVGTDGTYIAWGVVPAFRFIKYMAHGEPDLAPWRVRVRVAGG